MLMWPPPDHTVRTKELLCLNTHALEWPLEYEFLFFKDVYFARSNLKMRP